VGISEGDWCQAYFDMYHTLRECTLDDFASGTHNLVHISLDEYCLSKNVAHMYTLNKDEHGTIGFGVHGCLVRILPTLIGPFVQCAENEYYVWASQSCAPVSMYMQRRMSVIQTAVEPAEPMNTRGREMRIWFMLSFFIPTYMQTLTSRKCQGLFARHMNEIASDQRTETDPQARNFALVAHCILLREDEVYRFACVSVRTLKLIEENLYG
jgi:hypothetical protein